MLTLSEAVAQVLADKELIAGLAANRINIQN